MTELEKQIAQASQAYYTWGDSELTDAEFDVLLDKLRQENPDSPLLTQIGHGYTLTSDTTPGAKVPHKYGTAGSLTKAYSYSEINKSVIGADYVVDLSSKMDGLSVVLYYERGVLVQALTRGNGVLGVDITAKIKVILGSTIADTTFTGAVRGEIIMSFKQFEVFNAAHPEFANIRNSCVGIVKRNAITTDLEYLDVVVYSIVGTDKVWMDTYNALSNKMCIECMRTWLSENFTHCAPAVGVIGANTEVSLMNAIEMHKSACSAYPTDGVVITNPYADVADNGYVCFNAQAYKFKSETAEVDVLDVLWKMSKTGYCIPRVQYTPVRLAGTTVQYATGISAKYIKDNSIGVGAVVEVEKHGEIIPNINVVIKPAHQSTLPTTCPACNSELAWCGVHLKCENPVCSNATAQDTMIWTSILAPIDNLGDKLKASFFAQLYDSIPSIEELMFSKPTAFQNAPDGTQAYRMKQMFDRLYSLCDVPLSEAIKALNIPRFGDKTADALAQHPQLVKSVLEYSALDTIIPIELVDELNAAIGQANTKSLIDNRGTKLSRLNIIASCINWEASADSNISSKGKVAITGKLSVKRTQFEDELKAAGFTPSDITKDTKYLITDDLYGSSSKNKKADTLGITKITEQDFRSLYI